MPLSSKTLVSLILAAGCLEALGQALTGKPRKLPVKHQFDDQGIVCHSTQKRLTAFEIEGHLHAREQREKPFDRQIPRPVAGVAGNLFLNAAHKPALSCAPGISAKDNGFRTGRIKPPSRRFRVAVEMALSKNEPSLMTDST